jgi:hypothetical protein
MNQKPSEKIKQLIIEAEDDAYPGLLTRVHMQAILEYLDEEQEKQDEKINLLLLSIKKLEIIIGAIEQTIIEEQEKPKYACPNCLRVVDELITCWEVIEQVGLPCKPEPSFFVGCKHCLNKK